jgi:hypothetical protein
MQTESNWRFLHGDTSLLAASYPEHY